MNWQSLQVDCAGSLATVRLNRPELRNAFDEIAVAELADAFTQLGGDVSIRAIVLAANGPAFCAGADLQWMRRMAAYSQEENLADAERLGQMLHIVHACPKPVVAKVQGDCYAGGMGLAAACDIVVAADHAQFCLSEVKLGLIPATISPYVIRAMGEQAARRYFLTAEKFSAHEAHRIGFVHEAVEAGAMDAAVQCIVASLLANGPGAVEQAKQLVRDVAVAAPDEALLKDTAGRIAAIRGSAEAREGIQAFLEKRKPGWDR